MWSPTEKLLFIVGSVSTTIECNKILISFSDVFNLFCRNHNFVNLLDTRLCKCVFGTCVE